MTAFNQFWFYGYCLRPASEKDLDLARDWNAKDADHASRVDPTFWIHQEPGQDAYVLMDVDKDSPLFFIKLIAEGKGVIELHIQFGPKANVAEKKRRAEALAEGLMWLEKTLKTAGIGEIFFKSKTSGLILFAEKRLGFVADPVPTQGDTVLRKQLQVTH